MWETTNSNPLDQIRLSTQLETWNSLRSLQVGSLDSTDEPHLRFSGAGSHTACWWGMFLGL